MSTPADPLVSLRARAEVVRSYLDRWVNFGHADAVKALDALVAALEAAERERETEEAQATYAIEAMEHATIRAEAAEARLREVHTELEKSRSELLAAQQALQQIASPRYIGGRDATKEIAREALAAVGRDPQKDSRRSPAQPSPGSRGDGREHGCLASQPPASPSGPSVVGRVPAQEDKP